MFDNGFDEIPNPWYPVQVRPNCLQIAKRNLIRQGFYVFGPRERIMKPWRGRYRQTEALLFPGYIFVGFDPKEAPWRAINATYGVIRLVTFGEGYPRAVPQDLITNLQIRCDASGLLRPPEDLCEGDLVRVTSGPFAELVSRVESLDGDTRVSMLFDFMGRLTRFTLGRDLLKKVPG
jgi:transcriptional antiterminator RfaH